MSNELFLIPQIIEHINEDSSGIFTCKACDIKLSTTNPASQYQTQKVIQNTVRVSSSLYTMNLGALSAYKKPLNTYQVVEQSGTSYITPPRVNWNQMSDRPSPSVQRLTTSIVKNRPGAMSPGGTGVDIKHNSYDRYLRRLKGKAPLRRGLVTETYGEPLLFNRAYPIYGGKNVKTAIINKCNCATADDYNLVYQYPVNPIFNVAYTFNVGDWIFAKKKATDIKLYKAIIKRIVNNYATIEFTDGFIVSTHISNLRIYYKCDCNQTDFPVSIIDKYLDDNEFIASYNASALFCEAGAVL